jgi:hypothetical protein
LRQSAAAAAVARHLRSYLLVVAVVALILQRFRHPM